MLLQWDTASGLAMLAGVASAAAYPFYYQLLKNMEPAEVAVCQWLQTLVAVGESALLFRQRPSWMMGGAAITLIVCSVILLRRDASSE